MVETICSGCGRELEDDPNKTCILCPHCKWFVPRGAHSYRGRKKKLVKGGVRIMGAKKSNGNREPRPGRSLLCVKCKQLKKAGKKRVEKWKGQKYQCRECRPSKKKKSNK